ncbi:MAG: hypothetical protein ABI411_10910 [Tahibacter sp.]
MVRLNAVSTLLSSPLGAALLVLAGVMPGVASAQFMQILKVGTTADCTYSTIQAAINASVSGDTIRIQGGATYSEHLTITGKSLTLSTGTCTPVIGRPESEAGEMPSAVGQITISGSGGANTAVLTISGTANVTLKNLLIRNGHSSGNGGGIYYNGAGSLNLFNVMITQNVSNGGGGIDFNGTGSGASLFIGADTIISNNTAHGSGGGIRLRGASSMLMDAPAAILVNHADAEGGGLQVISPATADIGSPGIAPFPAFVLNDATNGGAIAIYYNTGTIPLVRLYTTDPQNPMELENNSASNVGGGIYIHGENDDLYYDTLAMFDVRFNGNTARNGAAWFQDDYDYFGPGQYSTSRVSFNRSEFVSPPTQAVRCAANVPCNDFVDNATIDINGNPTNGALIYVSAGGYLDAERMRVTHNTAAQFLMADDDDDVTSVMLYTSLIADNVFTDCLIRKNRATILYAKQSTIAHNDIGGGSLIIGDVGYIFLENDIIDQPETVYTGGGDRGADYVLTSDPLMAGYGTNLIHGAPLFANPADGNYHLAATRRGTAVTASPGIDVLAPISGDDRDLDYRSFDQNVSAVPDRDGVRDLGAFEAQPIARIFGDGFGDGVPLVD